MERANDARRLLDTIAAGDDSKPAGPLGKHGAALQNVQPHTGNGEPFDQRRWNRSLRLPIPSSAPHDSNVQFVMR